MFIAAQSIEFNSSDTINEEEVLDAEEMHQDINYNSCESNGKNITVVSQNFHESPLKKKFLEKLLFWTDFFLKKVQVFYKF